MENVEWPYGNKNMSDLDIRFYNLKIEIEKLNNELYLDSQCSEPQMVVHYNVPAQVQNFGVQCSRIANMLKHTHE